MSQLDALRACTTLVADTGDFAAIARCKPEDATTNPSLLLKAVSTPEYRPLLDEARAYARAAGRDGQAALEDATDRLAVLAGRRILDAVPGRVSTEVDARTSFDTEATLARARKLVAMYDADGVPRERVLIKVAATWEGIRAAATLEKENVQCNLTLLFSFAQAKACADAGVFLISPFVGRIYDWYRQRDGVDGYAPDDDPGVKSVRRIYAYYKRYGYATVVMGASFRNAEQVLALAGCDRLTISPALLDELATREGDVPRALSAEKVVCDDAHDPLNEAAFRWQHNDDAMATDKLAEGIRLFAADQVRLEDVVRNA